MSKTSRIFNAIKQSLRGEMHDYTSGSIRMAVFLLAVPMILELSLESLFAVVDIFFVSKLGREAIDTVGLTESVITIVYSVAIGLSAGAGAIVARRTGEKDKEGAARAGAQSIIVAFIVAAFTTAMGMIFAPDILHIMGGSEKVVKEGAIFTRILFGGSLSIILIFLINGIFRGAGDPAMAMRSLWIASIINIILCPVLIHFFGLKGAAIATLIGRSSGVLYQCYHLFRGDGHLKFIRSHFTFDLSIIKNVIKIAWPATLQFFIASGSWMVIARLVATTGGENAFAGYQVAIRNLVFFILPAWGLSNAAATLVGQNLGANKIDRAEKSVALTLKYNMVFMAFVSLIFIFLAKYIIRFYTKDEAIAVYGEETLRIVGFGFIFYGLGMVMTQALNGAGDSKTPTMINFICFWLFQIPFAYLLAVYFDLKSTGAVIAIPVAESSIALLSFYFYKKGKWKTVKV